MKLELRSRKGEPDTASQHAAPIVGLVVGGVPAVSLLPTEIRSAGRDRAIKQILVFVLFAAVLIGAGTVGLSSVVHANAEDRLTTAQATGQQLQVEVAKFADIQKVARSIALGKAAVRVGGSTEIDWQAQLADITGDMPAGYRVTTVVADSATPIADYPQGTTPIEKPRAATVVLTVETANVEQLPDWLRALRDIPAYADAVPNVSYDAEQGYTVQLTVHLSPKAVIDAPAQEVGE